MGQSLEILGLNIPQFKQHLTYGAALLTSGVEIVQPLNH